MLKNSSLHSSSTLIGKSDEIRGGMNRRMLHPGSSDLPTYSFQLLFGEQLGYDCMTEDDEENEDEGKGECSVSTLSTKIDYVERLERDHLFYDRDDDDEHELDYGIHVNAPHFHLQFAVLPRLEQSDTLLSVNHVCVICVNHVHLQRFILFLQLMLAL